ncbi:MAG: SLBB domain-containing protein [Candidatus Delongbacteria bacterium]|jgi:polysaccharide export outer membrane protein|nr:SLBB domain-containing protein [Candidatus Delongbacteria bacterium]
MQKIHISRYYSVLIFIFFLLTTTLISQDNSFIKDAQIKVTQDFQKGNLYSSPEDMNGLETDLDVMSIPQSELLDELIKPGNEELLKSFKEKIILEDKNNEDNQAAETEQDEEIKDEDKDKDKDKKGTGIEGLLFQDNLAYYNSIKEFFGYDIFLRFNEQANLNYSLLATENHVIGPGDEIDIKMWGDTQLREAVTVSKEGTIYISDVGLVTVYGEKFKNLEPKLKNILRSKYITLDPPNAEPSTFLDISLSKMHSITVYVNGEVVSPGSYNMNANSTILNALKISHGVSAKGTLRDIVLVRDGVTYKHIDLYDYFLSGKSVQDILLRDNDNIFIGPRKSTVSLKGEVFKPLKFELKKNETLKDLLRYAGGLLPTSAVDKIEIERLVPYRERTTPVVTTKILNLEYTKIINNKLTIKSLSLEDNDVITVLTIPKFLTDYVSVNGAVYRQGRFEYSDGMSIKDLIVRNGGFLSDAYLKKTELIRTLKDSNKRYFSLNLESEQDLNFKLNSKDSINIYSKWSLKSKNIVLLTGKIRNPGFSLISDNERISDLIFSKGGIVDERVKKQTYLLKADLIRYNEDGLTTKIIPINLKKVLNGDQDEDLFLKNGDHLKIYGNNVVFDKEYVTISGYVKSPNDYSLSTNMTVEDLVLMANGFDEGAYKFIAEVFRMNKDNNESNILSSVYKIELEPDFLKKYDFKKSKFLLEDKDHVVIRRNPNYIDLRKIFLGGEVKFPGVYSLLRRDETMRQIINRAGGVNTEAFIDGMEFKRDSTNIVSDFNKVLYGDLKYDIVLKNGDRIYIPKHPGTVSIEGYVYTPGLIKYRSDWSLDDYIEAAGGKISDLEYKAGDTVIYYPGGNAKVDNGWMFTPEVKEGSKIVVPKLLREPNADWNKEIRNWVSVATSTLTLLVLINALN